MESFTALAGLCEKTGIEYKRQVPLSEYTTFRIGGTTPIMVFPSSEEQLSLVAKAAQEYEIKLFILGRGSNLLFPDQGYSGAVLCLGNRFADMELFGEDTISCQSGASLMQLCRFALEHSLSGLEFAYGIPGTVGGAIYMNAGAYGGEISDVLLQAGHISPDGESGSYRKDQLALSYRHSVYMEQANIITKGIFRLKKDCPDAIKGRMEDYMRRRKEKQPLEFPSAGSTFKRPQGAYASALIDQCGLKGKCVGGAQVSTKHAGFVINTGGATCGDVLELVRQVKVEVQDKTGFLLECEVKIVEE